MLFRKIESEDKIEYENFYSRSKAEIIMNRTDIDDAFESIYTTIITNIQKSLSKGSGWIIDSVIDPTTSISKYNPLAGISYIKLLKELDHVVKKKNVDILLIREGEKNIMFLSKISRHLCMITTHYIAEKNIFAVIFYMLLLQKKC